MASARQLKKFQQAYESRLYNLLFHQYWEDGKASRNLTLRNFERLHQQELGQTIRNVRLSAPTNNQELHDLTWEWSRSVVARVFEDGAEWWAANVLLPAKALELDEEQETPIRNEEVAKDQESDIVKSLQELADLKEKGLIDDEEFKSAKKKILESP